MSWYQRARDQYGMSVKREFPTLLEECFQTPIEGAIFAEIIDRLRACGGAEIRVIDCDSDFDLTPVQRVAYMLNKEY